MQTYKLSKESLKDLKDVREKMKDGRVLQKITGIIPFSPLVIADSSIGTLTELAFNIEEGWWQAVAYAYAISVPKLIRSTLINQVEGIRLKHEIILKSPHSDREFWKKFHESLYKIQIGEPKGPYTGTTSVGGRNLKATLRIKSEEESNTCLLTIEKPAENSKKTIESYNMTRVGHNFTCLAKENGQTIKFTGRFANDYRQVVFFEYNGINPNRTVKNQWKIRSLINNKKLEPMDSDSFAEKSFMVKVIESIAYGKTQ